MNYTEYTNPKATEASKKLAIATLLIALIGIIAAVYVIASGAHSVWGLLIILIVLAVIMLRPRIESILVARILDEGNTGEQ